MKTLKIILVLSLSFASLARADQEDPISEMGSDGVINRINSSISQLVIPNGQSQDTSRLRLAYAVGRLNEAGLMSTLNVQFKNGSYVFTLKDKGRCEVSANSLNQGAFNPSCEH